jgi:hypothetical protein
MGKLPECVNSAVKFGISQQRIAAFLRCGDVESYVESLEQASGVVDISGASFDAGATAAAEHNKTKAAAASTRDSHTAGGWWRRRRQPLPAGPVQLEICSPLPHTPASSSLLQSMRRSAADAADDAYRLDVRTGDGAEEGEEAEAARASVSASPILQSISCSLSSGLTMICGSVGSGHTAEAASSSCCTAVCC